MYPLRSTEATTSGDRMQPATVLLLMLTMMVMGFKMIEVVKMGYVVLLAVPEFYVNPLIYTN